MKVPKRSIYGLLGPNGAGKTTVFKLLMGLLTPTAGNIRISGMDTISSRSFDRSCNRNGCLRYRFYKKISTLHHTVSCFNLFFLQQHYV
ncbi:ATP-binding cassette domain-containing protein [Anaerocolumna cellulosilytica]|uniref:ATP-binding cassette domain-containing protein n=1 Tax=Anaerocolumna cellulosilytica TaxID=433286 RepID=UPI00160CBEF4